MKIKRKISLGVGLLFSLILVLAVVSVKQINSLSKDSENILKNNHQSLTFITEIQVALNKYADDQNVIEVIDVYIRKQKNNITEPGEKELTDRIDQNIKLLSEKPKDTAILKSINSDLLEVMKLNLEAIQVKNKVAQKTSVKSILWISALGASCFLIALLLLIKLPGSISRPIEELTKSIQQIASKNYSQRVNFENHIDFGELAKSFNMMAAKLDEYNNSNLARIIAEKKITETLVNKIHDPIIGLDKNLVITFANDEFLSISGLSYNDTVGHSVLELSVENELVSSIMIMNSFTEIDRNVGNETNKHINLNWHGKDLFFEKEIQEISHSSQQNNEKRLIGYVVILRNITKFKELDIAKTNFIASVSHELKTPISSIKMGLQLLENNKIGLLNEEQKKLVNGIYEDAERLLKTTGELLRMSQVESGKIQINLGPVDLLDVLKFAISSNKRQAELKNIEISTSLPKIIPEVQADRDKISWVLTNLVSNAINYSKENSNIYISIKVNDKKVELYVRDTGKGIDPQYIDKIFDKYFRIPEVHQTEGTGLGLAICKEFIEAQGGKISVISKIKEGSTFSISLNLV